LTFLGLFAMFSLSPRCTFYTSASLARTPRKLETGLVHCAVWSAAVAGSALHPHPQTSYWLGGANEMAAINTILIIVNRTTP
jgi:hypothetical protein